MINIKNHIFKCYFFQISITKNVLLLRSKKQITKDIFSPLEYEKMQKSYFLALDTI